MGEQRPAAAAPLAASGMAAVGQGKLGHVLVTPGSDATTITIWDSDTSTTTNDTKLFYGKFVANAKTEPFPYIPGIQYEKGLYVEISGTSVAVLCCTY